MEPKITSFVPPTPTPVQRNSELAGVLQLLFPIASKWKVLATTLGAPQELIASLSALPHETALEQLVQQWWHANPGLGPSDRREMLITALGNSDVGEGDIAVKVWEGKIVWQECTRSLFILLLLFFSI